MAPATTLPRFGISRKAIGLHDLSVDPAERNDIAAQNPGKVKLFEKLMSEARTGTPVFPLELKPGQKTVSVDDLLDP